MATTTTTTATTTAVAVVPAAATEAAADGKERFLDPTAETFTLAMAHKEGVLRFDVSVAQLEQLANFLGLTIKGAAGKIQCKCSTHYFMKQYFLNFKSEAPKAEEPEANESAAAPSNARRGRRAPVTTVTYCTHLATNEKDFKPTASSQITTHVPDDIKKQWIDLALKSAGPADMEEEEGDDEEEEAAPEEKGTRRPRRSRGPRRSPRRSHETREPPRTARVYFLREYGKDRAAAAAKFELPLVVTGFAEKMAGHAREMLAKQVYPALKVKPSNLDDIITNAQGTLIWECFLQKPVGAELNATSNKIAECFEKYNQGD